MGWTKQYRDDLVLRAAAGDTSATARLEEMRRRNCENKRRSDVKHKDHRAKEALERMVSTAIERRVPSRQESPATSTQSTTSMDIEMQSRQPSATVTQPTMPMEIEVQAHQPSAGLSKPRDLVGASFAWTERRGANATSFGVPAGFEGVRWRPLSRVVDEREARIELEKLQAIETAVRERKEALRVMVERKEIAEEAGRCTDEAKK